MVWQQMAIEAQTRVADIQGRIADIQAKQFEWHTDQATKNETFAKQIQALEQVRHNETRRDVAWQGWVAIGLAVLASIVSIVSVIVQVAYSE